MWLLLIILLGLVWNKLMAKLTLNAIGSRYGSIDALNDNSDLIEAALENTLSRDGAGPNNMESDLDMDSNNIINLADGVNNTDAVTVKQLNGGLQGVVSGNIVKLREIATATAGQTVFNLSSLTYTPASNNLSVYIQGIKQRLTSAYTETDNNTITFTAAVPVTAVVEFIVNDDI
jgi:uncharacterized membrane protein